MVLQWKICTCIRNTHARCIHGICQCRARSNGSKNNIANSNFLAFSAVIKMEYNQTLGTDQAHACKVD